MAQTQNKTEAKDYNSGQTIFEQAVNFVLLEKIEGGYVNDPRDPSGETNFGISKRAYPKLNIAKLTREKAIEIYKRDFWDAAGCSDLPPRIAIAVFDCAVNQGVDAAKKLLQRTVDVKVDGVIGKNTLAAIGEAVNKDEDDLVLQYLGWRLKRYSGTANAAVYMRGWANRVLELHHFLIFEINGGVANAKSD